MIVLVDTTMISDTIIVTPPDEILLTVWLKTGHANFECFPSHMLSLQERAFDSGRPSKEQGYDGKFDQRKYHGKL